MFLLASCRVCCSELLLLLQGFLLHVTREHNMWSYMHFMLQVSNVDPSDFTALELHVYRMVRTSQSVLCCSLSISLITEASIHQ